MTRLMFSDGSFKEKSEEQSDQGCTVYDSVCIFIKQFSVLVFLYSNLSRVMKKPTFCICEKKDADQFRGNRKADQRLCFRYIDGTIPLLSKSEISSL